MSISKAEMIQLSNLAKIELSDSELEGFQQDLDKILAFVEEINNAEVADLHPMAHPIEGAQPLREDIPMQNIDRHALQTVAPNTDNGLYLVPKVIE